MLTDAIDGTLSPADQATFDLHLLSCSACSTMLADAQRGAAWLEMLKSSRPEPSATLLNRILAETSGAVSNAPVPFLTASANAQSRPNNTLLSFPAHSNQPAAAMAGNVLPFRSRVAAAFNLRAIGQTMLQPRLAMTAAMAFFSIAVTLNLTGVKLSDLRANDLKPSSIKRGFYEANARVTRYYANLRVVYELESRVRDLQRDNDGSAITPVAAPSSESDQKPPSTQPDAKPEAQPDQKKPRPRGPGTSRSDGLDRNLQFVAQNQFEEAPAPDRRSDLLPSAQTFVALAPSVMYDHKKQIQEGGMA
jgi:hypothetical protein